MPTDRHLIPSSLLGDSVTVKRRWKRIATSAIKAGHWDVPELGELIVVEETNARISLWGPFVQRETVAFHMPWVAWQVNAASIADLTSKNLHNPTERRLWFDRMYRLFAAAHDNFWVALALLGSDQKSLPAMYPFEAEYVRSAGRHLTGAIIRWWEDFESLEYRFCGVIEDLCPWPAWRWPAARMPLLAGYSYEMADRWGELTSKDVGHNLRTWIESSSS